MPEEWTLGGRQGPFSLTALIRRFWRLIAVTWGLVLLEAVSLVAFPAVIGRAVDDLLADRRSGVVLLGGLCFGLLLIGAARRCYDTRAYTHIHRVVADELVERERRGQRSVSSLTARCALFEEFVGFLEESAPALLNEVVALLGTLVLIAVIDIRVCVACLIAAAITALVYWLSDARIYARNSTLNDEHERTVSVLQHGGRRAVQGHLRRMARSKIALSDLETMNYAIIWAALTVVIIYTVVTVALSGAATTGVVLATVMYVFGFAEAVLALPLYYAQVVRLREIATRLCESSASLGSVDQDGRRRQALDATAQPRA